MRLRTAGDEWSPVDRAAFIAAVASVGPTFGPSRLPRNARDQTIAVGVVSAVNYAVVSTGQTAVHAAIRIVLRAGGRDTAPHADLLANLGGIAVGLFGSALADRTAHPTVGRAMGRRLAGSCAVGFAASAVAGAGRRSPAALPGWARPSSRTTAAVVGAAVTARSVRAHRPQADTTAARAVLTGTAVSAGLIAIGKSEHAIARGIAAPLARALPAGPVGAGVAAVLGRACVLATTTSLARAHLHRGALSSQAQTARIEADLTQPPATATVSGGPGSATAYDTLSQEGSRFVHRVTDEAEITRVVGTARAAPVRAYVGLWSGATPAERVRLALHDLDAFGAFERSVLCLAVPAGTGFVNSVAISALEYLTAGDCATVAMQYSLRRSYYSLDRVGVSVEQNRLLLSSIAERIASRPAGRRPRLVLYGESLGALAAHRTLDGDGIAALDAAGVELALFAGTPCRSTWAARWRARPAPADGPDPVVEVASYAEWAAIDPARRDAARAVLLSHHDDPVTVFDRWLLIRPARADRIVAAQGGPAAPFRPLTTFTLTALDLKNAMAGADTAFTTIGHDYRGDLARFVSTAYRLPCDDDTLDRIEHALRER